ncbi:MAG: hypothetical protein MMC23_007076 [Stictis urceolatum]|nr:hypothetical protein [Stictis urceolata]
MADEVRRSGRATKGQHTKNDEEPEPKKKGKGGRTKKQVEPEPEPEAEAPAIIRCICGYVEEDENDEGAMICCDKCLAWQHNVCMGMPIEEDELPDQYFCEQCKPKDHKELLAAIERGEKPWLERQAQHEREEQERKARKRKGGKKGKKGKAVAIEKEVEQVATPAKQSQSPVVETKPEVGQKRKAPDDIAIDIPSPAQVSSRDPNMSCLVSNLHKAASKSRKVSTPKEPKPAPRRQSSIATPVRKESLAPIQAELVENISDLQNPSRQRAAKALERLFVDQTEVAKKQGTFKQAGAQSNAEFGLKLALKVEYALYLNLWGHGSEPNPQYGEKLRMMLHNVKANPTLRDRLLNGLLSANAFSQMDSFQMASKEKQAETAQILKETEKQHILVQEEGPRIRRTHKGDEFIGDEAQHLTGEQLTSSHVPRQLDGLVENGEDNQEEEGPSSPNAVELPDDIQSPGPARPLRVDTKAKPPPTHRKSSSNFDINNVWSNVESPHANNKQPGSFPTITGKPSQTASGPGVKADPEIDSLLKDEEDDEPYSPMDYVMEPGTVWRGSIVMPTVTDFRASAKFVAGFDPSPVHSWGRLMPTQLTIEGRIDVSKATQYLCGLQWSKSTNVSVAALTPAESAHDRQQFDKLFAYFTERLRYGVIGKSPVELVRDIYVVPLEAGDEKRPEFIELLEHCDVPPTGRPTRILLVVYVIKVRAENVPAPGSAVATPRQPEFAGSPVAPPGGMPHMSPAQAPGGFTPGQGPAPAFSPQPSQSGFQPPPTPNNDSAANLTGWEAAHQILGPDLAGSPVISTLLQQAPGTGVSEFKAIKGIMERVPQARVDMTQLTDALRQV